MKKNNDDPPPIEQAVRDLFDYAVDREDIKYLLTLLPARSAVKSAAVDYELQLLKIITVGWSLSYHLYEHPLKNQLADTYWREVRRFSDTLSQTTNLMIGQTIDYFETVKNRMDAYVSAVSQNQEAGEPVAVIGPVFAKKCGDGADIFVRMAGAKLFLNTTTRVKRYVEATWRRCAQ